MGKITIDRGTTYTINGTYTDSSGTPVDITGASIRFTAKANEWDADADDSDAAISKAGVITSAAGGTYSISLTDTDTFIDDGKYWYDIKIETAGGAIYRLDKGRLIIDGSPTNRTT